MREANYYPLLEEQTSSPILYGVARGLEDLFPIVEHPRFSDSEEDAVVASETDTDKVIRS